MAVRESLSSAFQNIYAEGYPEDDWRAMSETEILDYGQRLSEYRRYADPRYYKGVEYADVIESLVAEVITANPAIVAELRAGKDKAFNALVGKVMAASRGKANPAQVNAILKRQLDG
jgi:Asp-tRNA(Asn)/Glu-tRNA(Gln) amidotransferase B subunit